MTASPPARAAFTDDVRAALRRPRTGDTAVPAWSRPDPASGQAINDARGDLRTVEWALLTALGHDPYARDQARGLLHRDLLKGAGVALNISSRRRSDAVELFLADAAQWLADHAADAPQPSSVDRVLWQAVGRFDRDDWAYVLGALLDLGEDDHDELVDLAPAFLQARFEWRAR